MLIKWKIPQLILCHLIVLVLITTFAWPATRTYWEMLDVAFFKWINGSLRDSPFAQLFWACANHRFADWIEDVFILGFFIALIRSCKKGLKLQGTAQVLFCIFYCAGLLFFVNRIIFREHFIIYRDSPTLVLENTVRLSKEIPWMRIKDDSYKCFPGDHATTAVLFAAIYSFFVRGRKAVLSCIYATFLCMPRMIAGAHWLSDVIVGSGSIALLSLSWALCTPFHAYCINALTRFLKFFTIFKKFKKVNT